MLLYNNYANNIIIIMRLFIIIFSLFASAVIIYSGYKFTSSLFNQNTEPVYINSSAYKTVTDRIQVLRDHTGLIITTPIDNIAYIITTYPNTIGPSSGQYKVALRVKPQYINQYIKTWLSPYTQIKSLENNYQWEFKQFTRLWDIHSTPKYYYSKNGGYAVLYRREGTLLLYGIL